MKIIEIKPLICDAFRVNWVFVKVTTDSGIYGVGEATLEMNELTVAKAIECPLCNRDGTLGYKRKRSWCSCISAPWRQIQG